MGGWEDREIGRAWRTGGLGGQGDREGMEDREAGRTGR